MGKISTVDIGTVEQGRLWVLYGRSNTGKDTVAATFPKPLLYLPIGDDGRASIKNVSGIRTIKNPVPTPGKLKELLKSAQDDTKFKTIVVSTFSYFTTEWKTDKATSKNKRMSQQLWGDLATDTEEIIRLCQKLAETREVVLVCHEVMDDQINDMEDEIIPNIRPNVTKSARPYLEGIANFGVHCAKFNKEVEKPDGSTAVVARYGCHIGPSPYYWTKVQVDKSTKVPATLVNPTYDKIVAKLGI